MKYEFKKLYSSPYMIACLGLLIAFMIFFVVRAYQSRDESFKQYSQLIYDYNEQGLSNEELVKTLSSKRDDLLEQVNALGEKSYDESGEYGDNLMHDFILYDKAANQAEYLFVNLPYHRREMVKDALYEISEEQSESQIKQYEASIEAYNTVIDVSFEYTGDLNNATLFFDYTIWDYAMILFVIILTVRMFTIDRAYGSYKTAYSTANGRGYLFARQISACLISAAAIIIVQLICQIICAKFFFGVSNLSLPIQAYEEYEFCPYQISIGEFFLIKALGKIILSFLIVSLSAMICVLIKRALPSIFSMIIIAVSPMLASTYFFVLATNGSSGVTNSAYEMYTSLRAVLPQCLLNPNQYFFTFDSLFLFGFEITRLECVIAITLLLSFTALAVTGINFAKARRT